MMVLKFDETKTTQAACFFLKLSGGKINYMVLIKLLYLLDRNMLLRRGQTVTGDEFYTMKLGPVLSRVHDLITEPSKVPGYWNTYISPPSGFSVSLLREPEHDRLSTTEEKLISSIWEDFKGYDPFDLCDLLHEILPEVKSIQEGRIPLTLTEVLTVGGRKTPEQAQEIINDLASTNAVHSLLVTKVSR